MSDLEFDDEAAVVGGLADLLQACEALHERRLSLGLSLDDVAARAECESWAIEWVDEGDVSAPAEALAYYAAAVGLRVEFSITE